MLINFFLILIVISFSIFYLNRSKDKLRNFIIFLFIFVPTSVIYFKKGSLESYLFDEKLKTQIEEILSDPRKLKDVEPNLIIIYLEKKLEKSQDDIQGWLILARTCVISGYYQKADLHYKNALKRFPDNNNLLLEYSILKKNLNQTKGALELLYKLKSKNSKNIKSRELIVEILYENRKFTQAKNEIDELIKLKKNDKDYIKELKKKYKLN